MRADSPARISRRARWLLAAVACLSVLISSGDGLDRGLFWDDYLVLRPRQITELLGVWHGTYDPAVRVPGPGEPLPAWFYTGSWTGTPSQPGVFYRPLQSWFYAAAFEAFGLNSRPLALISLFGVGLVAWLTALFVARESASVALGVVAAALVVAHPALTLAFGSFTNQFQQAAAIGVVAALLLWQQRRHALTPRRAWPIAAAVTIAALFKEDAVMIVPAILVLQEIRARAIGDASRLSRSVVLAAAAYLAVFAVGRTLLLGGLGGHVASAASVSQAALNLIKGPVQTLAWLPGHGLWSTLGSIASIAWLGIGLVVLWRTRHERALMLGVTGVVIMVCTGLPLLMIASSTRYYLVGLGAVCLLLAAGLAIFESTAPGSGRHRIALAAVASSLIVMFAAARGAQDRYRPCTSEYLVYMRMVEQGRVIPIEVRHWLAGLPERCRTGSAGVLIDSLPFTVWGAGPEERDPDGATFRPATNHLIALVHRTATGATLRVRAAEPVAGPVQIRVTADGADPVTAEVNAGEWRTIGIAFRDTIGTRLRGMHRLDVRAIGRPPRGTALHVQTLVR